MHYLQTPSPSLTFLQVTLTPHRPAVRGSLSPPRDRRPPAFPAVREEIRIREQFPDVRDAPDRPQGDSARLARNLLLDHALALVLRDAQLVLPLLLDDDPRLEAVLQRAAHPERHAAVLLRVAPRRRGLLQAVDDLLHARALGVLELRDGLDHVRQHLRGAAYLLPAGLGLPGFMFGLELSLTPANLGEVAAREAGYLLGGAAAEGLTSGGPTGNLQILTCDVD